MPSFTYRGVFQATNPAYCGKTYSPSIAALNPATLAAGGVDTTMHVTGSDFTASDVIMFNNVALPTTFVNSGDLTATVKPSQFSSGATPPVYVKGKYQNTGTVYFAFT